jgi:hypothetical protein
MTKYFSIATSAMSQPQQQALRDALKGYKWWHWLSNYWLVKDSSETLTAATVRDLFKAACPGGKCLVLDVEPKTWAATGIGKSTPGREWIKANWPPEGS